MSARSESTEDRLMPTQDRGPFERTGSDAQAELVTGCRDADAFLIFRELRYMEIPLCRKQQRRILGWPEPVRNACSARGDSLQTTRKFPAGDCLEFCPARSPAD